MNKTRKPTGNRPRPAAAAKRGLPKGGTVIRLPFVMAASLTGGLLTTLALLCLFALLFSRLPLPLGLIGPLACVSAALGAAASGFFLASHRKDRKLFYGLMFGLFYALCMAAGGLLAGHSLTFQGNDLTQLAAVVIGGTAGGAAAALRQS